MIADAFFAFLSWLRLLFFNREMELALYDFDDVNDDDDRNNTCFLCTPMCFVVLLYL